MVVGILCLVLGIHLTTGSATEFKRVYYITPLDHVPFDPSKVPVGLCTHIIYGFSKVAENNTLAPKKIAHIERYRNLTGYVKQKCPKVKVLLSVSEGNFSAMAGSQRNRSIFVQSAKTELGEWGFDGLDIDWEFPEETDRDNFVELLKKLNDTLKGEGKLLTLAVPGWENYINKSYRDIVSNVTGLVDFVNLMSYDYSVFNTRYRNFTGPNSPLFQWSNKSADKNRHVSWSAQYWVDLGMPREKIMVGIPTFGRTYHLVKSSNFSSGYYTEANGTSPGTNGKVNFEWACKFVKNESTTRVYDEKVGEPYAYKGWTWVSYDDFESVEQKVQWIKDSNFSGVMTYTLTSDDNNGTCGNGTYPLHHLIYNLTKVSTTSSG